MDLNSVQTNGFNETENTKQTKTKIEKKKKTLVQGRGNHTGGKSKVT